MTFSSSTSPFCPQCRALLSPEASKCPRCGWERPPESILPRPGEPQWQASLGFAPRGALVIDDLVIFWGGERRGEGALVALERRTGAPRWSVTVSHVIEGGVVQREGRLYFGTMGFTGGAFFCLEAATGREIWRRDGLQGGIWGRPVLFEAWGLVGLDSGQIFAFDLETGQSIPMKLPALPAGRLWAVQAGHMVLLLSDGGEALAVDPHWRQAHWPRPLRLESEPSGPPVSWQGKVFFGASEGEVWALDVQRRKLRLFASGLPRIVAAPAVEDGLLLVGGVGSDHRLRAYDLDKGMLRWESKPFAHSIATTPAVAEGLIAVTVNGGEVALLDIESGNVVWQHLLPIDRGLMADPVFVDGVIYAASDAGVAVALPWHGGKYAWAAEWLAARERAIEAGWYYAMAGQQVQGAQHDRYWRQAEQLWRQGGRPEWAAYLRENDLSRRPEEIAHVYEEAGMALAYQNPHEAVTCFLSAQKWYRRAGETKRAEHCQSQVGRVARGPYLQIRPLGVPRRWQEDAVFTVVVELHNLGEAPAEDVWARFSGVLRSPYRVVFKGVLPPEGRVEVEAPLVAHEPGNLVVEAHYRDAQGMEYTTTQIFEVREVVPFEGILIEGSVGMVKGLAELSALAKKVIVKGDVGFLDARFEQHSDAMSVPEFVWPEPPEGLIPPEQTLVRVHEITDDRFTVPSGHLALFLANESAMGKVSPGVYRRKDFPQLKARLGGERPAWKAVVFRQAPFRLAYRLGPFPTREGVQVGVELGLTAVFDLERPFEIWKGVMGENSTLTTRNLEQFLAGEIRGVVAQWLAGQPEAHLAASFAHRERLMLTLLEALRETARRFGLTLQEPMYWLNFVNPAREQADARRAAVYWKTMLEE